MFGISRLGSGSLLFPYCALGAALGCSAPGDPSVPNTAESGGSAGHGAAGSSFGGSSGAGTAGGAGVGGAAGSTIGGGGSGGAPSAGASGSVGGAGASGSSFAGAGSGGTSGTGGVAGASGGGLGGAGMSGGGAGSAGAGAPAGGAGNGGAGAGNSGGGGGGGGAGNAGTGGGAGGDPNGCVVKLEGWATTNADGQNGTTGGGNAAPTTVTTFEAFRAAAQDSAPRVIIVSGTIRTTDGGGSAMRVSSHKTIIGADKDATIYGGIAMSDVSNVIIRNLNVQGTWPNSGPDDTIASSESHHIWYDHLNVWDSTDGSLDITNQSSYQTVSWSKFWYTSTEHGHRLASLNGSGGGDHPEDAGRLKVTYHHNWWAERVDQRMPRVMYGQGHQYNNYFNSTGNSYCIGVGSYGAILVENNYFKDVNDPHVFMYDVFMELLARGNVYDNTTGTRDTGRGGTRDSSVGGGSVVPFTDPPYDYTLDDAADVPAVVQRCAGPQDWQ